MNAQLIKEIRTVFPATLAAASIPGVLELMDYKHAMGSDGGVFVFAIFTVFIAASSFGYETAEGTFSLLLSQPICRNRLWRLKMGVLALALAASFIPLAMVTSLPPRYLLWLGLPAFIALGLTPWLTLRFRDGFIAIVVTLAIEWVIVALDFQAFRWRQLLPEERLPSAPRYTAAVMVVALCCGIGLVAGYRALRSWRAAPARGPRVSFIQFGLYLPFGARPRSAVASLVLKELLLQEFSLFWMASFSIVLLALLFCFPAKADVIKGILQFNIFIFPIIVGAASFSRERQSGILDAQLSLPTSAAIQWALKLVTCFSLVLIGTILIPGVLLFLRSFRGPMSIDLNSFRIVPLLSMGTCLAILCSSVTRGMLRASILALATYIAFFVYAAAFTRNIFAGRFGQDLLQYLASTRLPSMILIAILSIIAFAALYVMLLPTLEHFRHPYARRNIAGLIIRAVLMTTLFLTAEVTLLVFLKH